RICLYVDVLPCRCISFGKEPQKLQVSEVVFRSVLARSRRNRRCLRLRFGQWIEYCELLVFWIFILDSSLYLVVLLWCCFWMYFGWVSLCLLSGIAVVYVNADLLNMEFLACFGSQLFGFCRLSQQEAGLVSRQVQLLSYIFIVSGVSGFGSSVWTGVFFATAC
ncbi:hypothetical protein RYX36_003705, partial [Vicia faba]